MGVRGLTTYIEKNKDKYLKNHILRDTHLVIDGNSLCAQLYKNYSKCADEFGGDYDKFARCIETFFSLLQQCNIKPIVILDGGYEAKKIKTVHLRLQNKLKLISGMNPACQNWATIFPLFHRECFKDVLVKLKIQFVRCDFEADLEIACVARKLNCPVLSYDSDFFIYDTAYIPFNSMDFYATKINDGQGSKFCIHCKIYRIETFLKRCKIYKSLLPLLATLLGNDYIKKNVFNKFYSHIKLPKRKNNRSEQHRTIIALLKWLENENFDSAVRKILSRVRTQERRKMAEEIKNVTRGYVCTFSEIFDYLGLEKNENSENFMEIDTEGIISEDEDTDKDDSADDSDDCSVDLSVDASNEAKGVINLDWFKNNVRNGNFPTLFIDILSLNMGIYQPQIEDTKNIESYKIFIPLLKSIGKILLQNSFFSFLGRNDVGRVKKYRYKTSNLNLPKINEIPNLNENQTRKILLKTLNISYSDFVEISQFPANWQLYILSLIYWVKNAVHPKVTLCHVNAIILCLLHLNIVDEKLPNVREKYHFLKKYEAKIKSILEMKKLTMNQEINDDDFEFLNEVRDVSFDDCILFVDSLVSNFKVNDKVKSSKNLFNLCLIDAFAQFQSVLLFVKYLNALLNFPLMPFEIFSMYNGTYFYNLFSNLEKRNNIDNYIELILKNATSLYKIYKKIMSVISSIVVFDSTPTASKKRKRKKKKTVVEKDEVKINDDGKSESDDEMLFDENNIFSILALTDVE